MNRRSVGLKHQEPSGPWTCFPPVHAGALHSTTEGRQQPGGPSAGGRTSTPAWSPWNTRQPYRGLKCGSTRPHRAQPKRVELWDRRTSPVTLKMLATGPHWANQAEAEAGDNDPGDLNLGRA